MSNSSNAYTINWWFADVATTLLKSTFVGALAGALTPYPLYGTHVVTNTRKFVPLPPFSSLVSMGYYAGLIGSVAAVQRFVAGGVAVARGREDVANDLLGIGAAYSYAGALLRSERRMAWNNRAVAGLIVGSMVYSNTEAYW